jgi:CAAX prenyl protease-like protein
MDQLDDASASLRESAPPLPPGWLGRWPWATFVLPFVVFAVVGAFEPTPPPAAPSDGDDIALVEPGDAALAPAGDAEPPPREGLLWWVPQIPYRYYPAVYTTKIVLTIIAMIAVWPGYRTFPFRVSGLAIGVGVVGAVLWIVLAKLRLELELLKPLGLGWLAEGERSAFDPLKELADRPELAYGFLAIRLIGLALVVPVIEEFFLRGFLMRLVVHDQWHLVPFGTVNRLALAVGTAFPLLTHPEKAAALVWFSLVSWLMVRTRNIWDCVAAHAVTNGLLGAWVIYSNDWQMM